MESERGNKVVKVEILIYILPEPSCLQVLQLSTLKVVFTSSRSCCLEIDSSYEIKYNILLKLELRLYVIDLIPSHAHSSYYSR